MNETVPVAVVVAHEEATMSAGWMAVALYRLAALRAFDAADFVLWIRRGQFKAAFRTGAVLGEPRNGALPVIGVTARESRQHHAVDQLFVANGALGSVAPKLFLVRRKKSSTGESRNGFARSGR